MHLLTGLREDQARWLRWLLIAGWLLLILSMLLPTVPISANRLFWGTVVPAGLLLIGAVSHELWRRLCPLAFVSQLARSLGRQRTVPGRGNRPEVVLIKPDSWLGQHHVQLQWSLLIAGLCLRLFGGNSSPTWLAVWLLLTLLAALGVGWAYGGKAWCQYFCPMAPVQTVLTGVRGPLGSTAHVATTARVTQSMCRTITPQGKEQSACVACQSPCVDIDAERAFWQTLEGKKGLAWAWYSYPGLVLGFFLLMEASGQGSSMATHPLGYLRSGAWALDPDLASRVWEPWPSFGPLPRLLLIPLLLTASAWLSVAGWRWVERALQARHERGGIASARHRAVTNTRLLSSFVAINLFFWFVDPFQGVVGDPGGQLLRSAVLVLSSVGLFRGWNRDQATYRRESASESLRRQLRELPGLEAALDGRSLEALSPGEVFTLVKALPALGQQQGRSVYQNVVEEMLRSGRLHRASALLELEELRQTLQLDDADHHDVMRLLARERPELLERDPLQLQSADLRSEAAAEAIEELLALSGLEVLPPDGLEPEPRRRLERIRSKSGLAEDDWQALLQRFGPRSELERQRLERLQAGWIREAGLAARLAELAHDDPMVQPLAQAMGQRIEGPRQGLDQRLRAAGLAPLPAAVAASGDLGEALELLWGDPDPDTAGWVLMLAHERDPQLAARLLQDRRAGLPDSPFLQRQRRGEVDPDRPEFPIIAGSHLFCDLVPEAVLWLAGQGHLRDLAPGERAMERGAPSDHLALIVRGDVRLQTPAGRTVVLRAGQAVGEMGVITGQPRSTTVEAGAAGASLFVLPASAFEELLRHSRRFGRGLLGQLAQRLVLANAPG
ncbi:MAG: Crp/Fnr family transcriptional regulator [Cyanobacteriota bacterium]